MRTKPFEQTELWLPLLALLAKIYDNCIVDLMLDTATRVKQASIMDKRERISENPSWFDNLKY